MTQIDKKLVNIVQAISYPLAGSSLIEASAGTGKTWTIAALYLRLILGHGHSSPKLPEQILVLTFTKAAARELKDRIRQRLSEAAEFFIYGNSDDAYLYELKNSITADKHAACARLLNVAAQSMDMAAISTIHSWCEKVLKQHAFDSGSLFEQVLTEDTSKLKHYSVWDYWRNHIAALPADKYAQVLEIWSGPSALNKLVKSVNIDQLPKLASTDLLVLFAQQAEQRALYINNLKKYWRLAAPELYKWLESLGKNFKFTHHHKKWLNKIQEWANSDAVEILDIGKGWDRLNPAGVTAEFTGANLDIISACTAIDELKIKLTQAPTIKDMLYKHAFVCLSLNLQQNLAKHSELDFDSLLINMERALSGQNANVLAKTLRQQYPVVLIDEFQDTDPIQYNIFNKIYQIKENHQDTAVIFIGDPKQSIYRFRGADIYTYISAAKACAARVYTLNKNYRSVSNMVGAVNNLFAYADKPVFITADKANNINFNKVQANGLQEKLIINNQSAKPISAIWLDQFEKPLSINKYRLLAAEACAKEIAQLLQQAKNKQAYLQTVDSNKTIKPSSIAILVNNHNEASICQKALAKLNVRSVYLSERASVFDSQQALEIRFLLAACLEPQNSLAVSAAMACPAVNMSQAELLQIKSDERQWDKYIDRFIKYKNIWQTRGVLPMLYKLIHDFSIAQHLLADNYNGERALTNILHLADLLQNASIGLDGPQALFSYLNQQIDHEVQNDANLLRLESDADLVKITTIHKSKGLEYPLVFLPFAASGSAKTSIKKIDLPLDININGERQLLFDIDNNILEQHLNDDLGEEIRKLYVALTRARHSVWLALKNDDQKRLSALSYIFNDNTKLGYSNLCQQYPNQFSWANHIDTEFKIISSNSDGNNKKPIRYMAQPAVKENWWISSYSALQIGNLTVDNYLEQNLLEENLNNLLAEDITISSNFNQQILANLPKGSDTGTFLHNLLQAAANNNFDKSIDLRDLVARRCSLRGWETHIESISDWLKNFIDNNWHINNSLLRLSDLNYSYPELEFLIPIKDLKANEIDDLIRKYFYPEHDRPALLPQHLNGMFKGYIDLCLQNRDGLYYVIDYKSNYLENYDDNSLLKSMLQMRYDVQMVLYALVLHKQLKMRMPDYNYDNDFGGAIYMYLRGQNSPNQGLITYKPSLELLEKLSNLFANHKVGDYV